MFVLSVLDKDYIFGFTKLFMTEHRKSPGGLPSVLALVVSCLVFSPICDQRLVQNGTQRQEQRINLAFPLEYSSPTHFRPIETGEIATSPDEVYEFKNGKARIYSARIDGDALGSRRLCVEYDKIEDGMIVSRTKYFSGNFGEDGGRLNRVWSYNIKEGKWIKTLGKDSDRKSFNEIVEEIKKKRGNYCER